MFYKGWGGKIASPILTILFLGFIVVSVWVSSIMWIVDLALFVVLWIMLIVALVRHRLNSPSQPERTIYMSMVEKKYNLVQVATSHKLLDSMAVFLVVISSIQIVKLIFLVVCYVFIPLFFIAPLYYIFCITPDLAFAICLANTETVTLFEPSRHVPSARNEIQNFEKQAILPQDASHVPSATYASGQQDGTGYPVGTNSQGQPGEVTPVRADAPAPLGAEPTEVTVMPV